MVRPLTQAATSGDRLVAAAIILSAGLAIGATIVLLAASGFDPAAMGHPGSLADKGAGAADLLRWGALLDMASYLPFAAPVLYLRGRLRSSGGDLTDLATAGGLAYVLIGGIGGALLAGGGPPLILGLRRGERDRT